MENISPLSEAPEKIRQFGILESVSVKPPDFNDGTWAIMTDKQYQELTNQLKAIRREESPEQGSHH